MKGERRRKKKKSRFGYYLYAVVVLLLTIMNISLATFLLTYVQNVHVTGTKNSKQSEIIAWMEEDPLTANSLYTLFKYKTGAYTLPVYLEDVKVSLSAPWSVKVKVTEKQIIGCLIHENAYVYFDEDGLVLKKSSEYEDSIPLIEGLEVEKSKKYSILQVNNEKVFDYFVNVTKEVEEHKLSPDRIVWQDDSMDLYFEQICVKLGKRDFDIKVLQLTAVLDDLEGKKGTLHLEHYTLQSKNFSFQEENY